MAETKQVKGIAAALLDFQQACPVITKDGTAGSKFTYKYASLPHIVETIKPHLKKAGLVFVQPIGCDERGQFVETILMHPASGQELRSIMQLPEVEFQGMNVVQGGGAVVTYVRRYALSSLLGIVTDEDDTDAAGDIRKKSSGATDRAGRDLDKPWLNRTRHKNSSTPTETWLKAVQYLATKEGAKIEDIEKKYRISKSDKDKLLEEALAYVPPAQEQGAGGLPLNTDFDKQGPSGREFPDGYDQDEYPADYPG